MIISLIYFGELIYISLYSFEKIVLTMGKEIIELEPKGLWRHFYNLTQIPRPSGHEEKVIAYIENFAEENKLKYEIDPVGNILVQKPAYSGMEGVKGIILQSHVDMVPQKNSHKAHDFTRDSIETVIDGGWLRANETTLGADNGIGVAAMLAILESDEMKHGPLEALFTINEEAGMEGAFGLKAKLLKGDILLNLDSEDEGVLFTGCAGGLDAEVTCEYKETLGEPGLAYIVTIAGLKGGHSGLDINLGRGNANKILARFLWSALNNFPLSVSNIKGGDMRNAIPRESAATIVIPAKFETDFHNFFEGFIQEIRDEFKAVEHTLDISVKPAVNPSTVIAEEELKRIVGMLNVAPHGVKRMSFDMPGIVESSLNLAVINISDGNLEVFYLIRSFVDSAKYAIAGQIQALHENMGCKVEFKGDYPGWKPNPDSFILRAMTENYQNMYNKTPEVLAIHAGLECGIIGGKYPNLDMISFGPTIRFPHSPDEKVEIKSVGKFWEFLKSILESIK